MSKEQNNTLAERKNALEQQIADIKARLPAHSIKPDMIKKLEELEDKLEEVRRQIN